MLYLQLIKSTWTKKSRGGAQAALRNQVPTTYPTELVQEDCSFAVQLVACDENTIFQPTSRLVHVSETLPPRWACAVLSIAEGRYRIGFVWGDWDCGAPKRPDRQLFSLHPGESARFRCNGRMSDADTGIWFYQMSVYNFINGDRLTGNAFTTALFKKDVSLLAALR